MTYEEVLRQFDGDGARSHLLFETFSLALLQEHLRKSDKRLIVDRALMRSAYPAGVHPDAVAQDGIGDLPGPTLIEVKLRPGAQYPPQSGFFTKSLQSLGAAVAAGGFQSVLLIFGESLSQAIREQLLARAAADWAKPVPFEVWDAQRLRKLVQQHREFVQSILPQIGRMRLERAMADAEVERDEAHSRDELIAKLHGGLTAMEISRCSWARVSRWTLGYRVGASC